MKYVAKPLLFNNIRSKVFDNPHEAVLYLNMMLSDKGVAEHLDYIFVPPSASEKNLKHALEEYIGIGKIIVIEDT